MSRTSPINLFEILAKASVPPIILFTSCLPLYAQGQLPSPIITDCPKYCDNIWHLDDCKARAVAHGKQLCSPIPGLPPIDSPLCGITTEQDTQKCENDYNSCAVSCEERKAQELATHPRR
jgi:hypothetical protein